MFSVFSVVNPSVGGLDADAEEGFGGVGAFGEIREGVDGFGVGGGGDGDFVDHVDPSDEVGGELGAGVEAGV